MKQIMTTLVLALAVMGSALAQEYRFEIGAAAGSSGYLGDVNKSNVFKNPGWSGGFVFRYIANSRWAVKADLLTAHISGDSKNLSSVFPDGQAYSFSSQLYDCGAQIEFNFFSFGTGPAYKKLKRFSPYMVVGIGATLASTSGKTAFTANIPMGVGMKYKLKERLNIGFEFTMRKAFGDKLDGLSDLNGLKSSFSKNTDWYAVPMFTITYEFSKRCVTCHYVD